MDNFECFPKTETSIKPSIFLVEKCVQDLFAEQAKLNPNKIAVELDNDKITYNELNNRADFLASMICSGKIGRKPMVGIAIERSVDLIIAVIAILKAGGICVPLDTGYPENRLEFMAKDSGIDILLTTKKMTLLFPYLTNLKMASSVLFIDSIDLQEGIDHLSREQKFSNLGDLIYVLYTSGSTGQPKGVAMPHRAVSNLIRWHLENLDHSEGSRTLQFAPISFDVSFQEIFSTLCSGQTLVLVSEETRKDPHALFALLKNKFIERIFLPVVALQKLAEVANSQAPLKTLKTVITAGEQLQITNTIKLFFESIPKACLYNHYGPTETHVVTSYKLQSQNKKWPRLPPIGFPIPNVRVYILDNNREKVSFGSEGELYLGGDCLAKGYHNRPELTKERFVSNPFGEGKLYKTGDLACEQPDGSINFLGRIDQQVKIRGYRVELGEVEIALVQHPKIKECVVTDFQVEMDHKVLVAYIVLEKEFQISLDVFKHDGFNYKIAPKKLAIELQQFISNVLPSYMLPSKFIIILNIPLTPNGKINRFELPMPSILNISSLIELVRRSSGTLEEKITLIWEELLQVKPIAIDENFFDLGGYSLLLLTLHKVLTGVLGYEFPMTALLNFPTIESLVNYLKPYSNRKSPDNIIKIPRKNRINQKKSQQRGKLKRQKQARNNIGSIRDSDIAIIGMACRFPGANNLEIFWKNLCEGKETISFFDKNMKNIGVNNQDYVNAGAILEDIESFDAEFFNFSVRDAEITDPQQRIFLECSWEALEDAGCNPYTYKGLIGVYAGAGLNTYLINNILSNSEFIQNRNFLGSMTNLKVMIGNDKDYLPTQVSYKLNLRGPSVSVQTACSTSLVALHLACQSILNGECDMALAGASNIIVPQKIGYDYQEDMIYSPDGHCRAFDSEACGTVFGSGVGVVLLKPLQKAINDGNSIYAVIKGTAINNDGSLKVGYTAPSVQGQTSVIQEAIASAEVESETITYIEAHGTATPLGDPIEITALNQAFNSTKKNFCAIGSVKTNLGHLGWAAGMAGLIKTVLSLQHKKIPSSLHFKVPNPRIDFEDSPFYINTELKDWNPNGIPCRAGVSSFGIGGTNAHVILEEAPQRYFEKDPQYISWHILTLSAKSHESLIELTRLYSKCISSISDTEIQNLCFTTNVGRNHFNNRLAFVTSSCKDAYKKLTKYLDMNALKTPETIDSNKLIVGHTRLKSKKIAFLFSGHGTKCIRMGRQLYETQPIFRKTMDQCNAIFKRARNLDLLDIIYPKDSTDTRINLIEFFEPAMFSLEVSLVELWNFWGVKPDFVMGHNVGEYVAACAAGVFSLEDGLKIVIQRGILMQALSEDIESAVIFSNFQEILSVISDFKNSIYITAENNSETTVISGRKVHMNIVCKELERRKIKIKKIRTFSILRSIDTSPFLNDFIKTLNSIIFSSPNIKIISNVTGCMIGEEIASLDYWCRHLQETIKFSAGVESLSNAGIDIFIEIGPESQLLELARQCLTNYKALWLSSLHDSGEDLEKIMTSLGQLYAHGYSVNWEHFHKGRNRKTIHLPTYPFQRQKYWIKGIGEE